MTRFSADYTDTAWGGLQGAPVDVLKFAQAVGAFALALAADVIGKAGPRRLTRRAAAK
jgi:hypothetical protein